MLICDSLTQHSLDFIQNVVKASKQPTTKKRKKMNHPVGISSAGGKSLTDRADREVTVTQKKTENTLLYHSKQKSNTELDGLEQQ